MADRRQRHRSRLYNFECIEKVLSKKMSGNESPFEGKPIHSSSYTDEFMYKVKGTNSALIKTNRGLVNGASLSIVLRQLPYDLQDFEHCLS